MRYRLRTLLILLAVGPPIIAAAWWCGTQIPVWVYFLAFIALLPDLLIAGFAYTFGALCHLIGWLPGGNDRKNSN